MHWFVMAEDATWLKDLIPQLTAFGTRIVGALLILLVGLWVGRRLSNMLGRSLERRSFDPTLTKFFANCVRYLILLLILLMCLGLFGADVTSFAAILAAMGFAVGLALQGTLSNFSAGIMLLAFRPFKVGDVVSMAGVVGKVNEIELFTTTVDTPDNRRIIIPNGSIFGSTIENITFHSERRVDVSVGCDYSADIDQTRAVLERVASEIPGQAADRAPQVVLQELGASSVDWQLRVWVPTGDFWPTREAIVRAIKVALDDANIGIPFPQMDVHLDPPQIAQAV
jgi:small conductance mechanosensitive channel